MSQCLIYLVPALQDSRTLSASFQESSFTSFSVFITKLQPIFTLKIHWLPQIQVGQRICFIYLCIIFPQNHWRSWRTTKLIYNKQEEIERYFSMEAIDLLFAVVVDSSSRITMVYLWLFPSLKQNIYPLLFNSLPSFMHKHFLWLISFNVHNVDPYFLGVS